VENILYQHPAIGECAVIGIADERWGEVGRAIIVVREGSSVADEELREFASARLAAYKVPKSFVRTGVLPRTASGKLLKRRLVETHGQP
jgi:fatty-acyl-CoA synthase